MSPPAPLEVDMVGVTDTSAMPVPDPLTINGVPTWREKMGQMPTGVAAACSSDMFKSPACYSKPKAKRFDHYFSLEAKSRKASTLKTAAQFLKNPGMISLGGGLPSADYFPLESLDMKVPTVPGFSPEATKKTGTTLHAGKHDIKEGKSLYDLEISLNYGQATGAAQLLRFVTEHTEIIHHPPYSDWQCTLTAGSTYAWDTALRLFCERGDYILLEEYTFASAAETAWPLGLKAAAIAIDEQGLIPEAMDDLLSNWDEKARGARKPFVLYTIPTGQNPTGATQSAERRKAVYKVAQKHDVIIVEDEPYYFLQMQPYVGQDAPAPPPPANHDEFIKSLVPSFLSLDVDGRVVRLESFSKVVAPGSRVGWIVASEQIIERFVRNFEVSSQNPSGISQLVLYKLLDEHWGHSGYLDWLINLRLEYTHRRDALLHSCEKHLPTEIAHWVPPAAGMFHWIEIDWKKHPGVAAGKPREEIEEQIFLSAVDHCVLLSRGSWFKADSSAVMEKMFFRATYAAASSEKIDEAISRFAECLRDQFKL
ncbi:Aromatic amino acid aminotransferase [Penicillium atrosanguineum]|uniref:aromatic-amino-acid transaminase n=1 Tax=Penicillium atrosanguineum TaxID=1132637 RepID=A0A9W9U0X9_9EURO|nr:aspartate aminotransferase [Penicillium atrosanguineum]KAJ5125625.1 Aromatic amino acid aminotransferase [Penicillium atrosanguineum]KAJ5136389.1 Aromatic amino acid aminotransferase [Penicillium atrosanguineum]KAJ5292737.1 aspartate aminotransferase [Penicillium atrosanguineum]KAJ5303238.1 Aromatic amino acid aminotransferase [Penicillium atrosanguineum]